MRQWAVGSSSPLTAAQPPSRRPGRSPLARSVSIAVLLFVFLLGVKALGEGFELLGSDLLERFFAATENPIIGLVVGLLATTVVQSSSVTTSMVVALVAAPETPLPLANAIPMIMGANIGTTVTSLLVSLAHLGRQDEFRRAFPVALCHDLFNYFTVLALLPVEVATGSLEGSARAVASLFEGVGGVSYQSPIRAILDAGYTPIEALVEAVVSVPVGRAALVIVISAALIFTALFSLVRVMRAAATGRIEVMVTYLLDSHALPGLLLGIVVTVMVQSSSLTTSLLVPLAAAGLLQVEQAFPVTLGAYVGTTVTAFMAALAVSGPNAAAGLEIALVHLLFNVTGIVLVYPVPAVRRVPLRLAVTLTRLGMQSRKMLIVCVALAFYGVPALVLFISRWLNGV
jgi:sodium-dependent phosphate cotransporter